VAQLRCFAFYSGFGENGIQFEMRGVAEKLDFSMGATP
jgi:hypothetical protein